MGDVAELLANSSSNASHSRLEQASEQQQNDLSCPGPTGRESDDYKEGVSNVAFHTEELAQAEAKKRPFKRKIRENDTEDGQNETYGAATRSHKNSSLCEAITKVPQYLYMVGGEALYGVKSAVRKSGALWNSDLWVDQSSSWQEYRVSVVDPSSSNTGILRTQYDKAFCVEWINNDQLAVSTKCGHILRVNRNKCTFTEIDLLGRRWIEPPITSEQDLRRYRMDRGGIHSIHANSSKRLLACSGGRDDDNNVYVLDLLSDKWATLRRGVGHTNWVFTLSWVSETAFVTGGRDQSVMLWNSMGGDDFMMTPIANYKEHQAKVRSSSYDSLTDRLVTMDLSGRIILWDPINSSNMRTLRHFDLQDSFKPECTCMLLNENMLIAGARDTVTIYDPRRPDPILSTPIAKLGYSKAFSVYPQTVAARSLAVHGCLLSIGLSTNGAVMCLDKRKLTGGCITPTSIDATKECGDVIARPCEIKRAAAALSHCVRPSPELPPWVQSKCRSEVIHAGGNYMDSPSKAARYNLRQRSKIRAPMRFTLPMACSALSDPPFPAMNEMVASTPYSDHPLDLTNILKPSRVFQQPRSEVHVDDMVQDGWTVDNAIFSHAWSPDGCSMFACGGPLAMGVRGCYMALWC